ncbi:hypothetical protein [Carboxylicivirga taeanensis]|uniref:hypothetical protein n=1 Tax=Carboxylicivirga taeanensis TaxID=1416875 RepID=UPI003F6DF8A8
MAYILNQIERLVTSIGNPKVCLIRHTPPDEMFFKADIINLTDTIKDHLLSESSRLRSDKKMNNLIRFYQSCLTRLVDQVQNKKCTCNSKLECQLSWHKPIISSLLEALTFINDQFADYFNNRSNMPEVYYQIHKSTFTKHLDKIKSAFEIQGVNTKTTDILLQPLTEFITHQKDAYSFSDKNYIYKWIKRLYAINLPLFSYESAADIYCKEIISYNLNSTKAFNFMTEFIKEKYQSEITVNDQLYTLKHFLKCVRQTRTVKKMAYRSSQPTIKKTLIAWLEAEINFILPDNIIPLSTVQSQAEKAEKSKHTLNTSVAQLGCLLKILVDTNHLKPTSKQALFRLFNENFKSKGSEDISIQNISNNFYSPLPSSWEAVKDDVLDILNYIQKNKN